MQNDIQAFNSAIEHVNGYWDIYLTVIFGILAYVFAASEKLKSTQLVIIAIAFSCFAAVNYMAMSESRNRLAVISAEILARQNNFNPEDEIKAKHQNEDERQHKGLMPLSSDHERNKQLSKSAKKNRDAVRSYLETSVINDMTLFSIFHFGFDLLVIGILLTPVCKDYSKRKQAAPATISPQ